MENSSGSKAVSITVKVIDTPGPVKDLKVKEMSLEHVTLSWDVPDADGGSVIANYVIEKRVSTRKAWQAVGSVISRTAYKCSGLQEGESYFFRYGSI